MTKGRDAECIEILRSCRSAMDGQGRLLVIDRIVGAANQEPEGKFADLMMLVELCGRERTVDEFSGLFQCSGFRAARVIPSTGRLALIQLDAPSRCSG